jgi:putative oxidoreductase
VQRLFSTFANGWPGIGLLLLRLLIAAALIHFGIIGLRQESPFLILALQAVGMAAALFILLGLWTPAAGAVVAVVKIWIALSRYLFHSGDPWIPAIQAFMGAALAMIGPGAWSVDARLFGRKHIDLPE